MRSPSPELEIQVLPGRLVVVRRTDSAGRRTTFEPPGGRYQPLVVDHSLLAELLLARNFDEYGARLWEILFGDPGLLAFYEDARSEGALRVILDITASEPELHGLLWEAMHARDRPPVAFDRGLTFARYLSARTWREHRLADADELALLCPGASAGYRRLGFRDEVGEAGSLAALVKEIGASVPLPQGWKLRRASASRASLVATLGGATPARALCLVCHGHMDHGTAFLALDADGRDAVTMVEVEALARTVAETEGGAGIPSLVVLAACQSAGDGGNEPGQALGSAAIRLVRAGIPCVLAVQGDIDKTVVVAFLKQFFALALGSAALPLEAAIQGARQALADDPEFRDTGRAHALQPVLFTRASSDYRLAPRQRPRRQDEEQKLAKSIASVAASLRDNYAVPVLGPVFTETALGSRRELAQYFARKYRYPTQDDSGLTLEAVLQFVKMTENASTAQVDLPEEVERRVAYHLREHLGSSVDVDEPLGALQARAAAGWAADSEYATLARLPFSRYVMISPDTILETMVAGMQGVTVESEYYRWRDELGESERALADRPTRERPTFYSLFGRLGEPGARRHMLLTEDDCFDYLMALNTSRRPSDKIVAPLQTQALLLLGMRVEDFQTRLLLHMMQRVLRRDNPAGAPSLCLQLDPSDVDADRRESLTRYMENYMQSKAKLQVVWCRPKDFLALLAEKLAKWDGGLLRRPNAGG